MKAASYFRLFVIHELIIPKELRLKFFLVENLIFWRLNIYCSKLKLRIANLDNQKMILTAKNRIQDFTSRGWWGNDTLSSCL